MKSEYRRELRGLKVAERKLMGDLGRLERQVDRRVRGMVAEVGRARLRVSRELKKVARRRLILEGRL